MNALQPPTHQFQRLKNPCQTNGNATTILPLRHEPLVVTKNKPAAAMSRPKQNKSEVIQIVADKQPIDQGQASDFASQKQAESFVANSASSSEIAEVSDPVLLTRTISPALLEASDMQLIEFPEHPSPAIGVSIKKPFSTRWSYALEGAGMSTLTSPASGGSLMAIAAKPLKNNRLSIETGFGYSYIQQPLTIVVEGTTAPVFENIGLQSNANYGLKDNIDSYDASTGVVTEYFQALKLHYIQVPVRLRYQISSRISMMIGMESAILLRSDSKYTSGGVLAFDNRNDESSTNASSGSINTSVIDFAASGGLNCRLSKAWSLQLGYKFGLKDVLPNNNYGDYNRMFQAGIRYDFRGKN
ncbi:MAG: PorT family protein [Saprospiraceae bacterium]|nr:PorT family protein [Saprospiraceae bacterium]